METNKDRAVNDKLYRACLKIINEKGLLSLNPQTLFSQVDLEEPLFSKHINSLNNIYDLIQDELFGGILRKSDLTLPWKEHLRQYANLLHFYIEQCPELVRLFSTRPAVTPNALQFTEVSYSIVSVN